MRRPKPERLSAGRTRSKRAVARAEKHAKLRRLPQVPKACPISEACRRSPYPNCATPPAENSRATFTLYTRRVAAGFLPVWRDPSAHVETPRLAREGAVALLAGGQTDSPLTSLHTWTHLTRLTNPGKKVACRPVGCNADWGPEKQNGVRPVFKHSKHGNLGAYGH